MPTIPSKRKKIVGGGVGMKGIVSALSLNGDTGILAAGTFTRSVGLYDSAGKGDCIAVFSVANDTDFNNAESSIGGSGITQTLWSPCGRYLYVAERKSDGVLVYDIRVVGKNLGCLTGRKANTNQRLGVELVPTDHGHEIWAGGTDGRVRIWDKPWECEGASAPSWAWMANDGKFSARCCRRLVGLLILVGM